MNVQIICKKMERMEGNVISYCYVVCLLFSPSFHEKIKKSYWATSQVLLPSGCEGKVFLQGLSGLISFFSPLIPTSVKAVSI